MNESKTGKIKAEILARAAAIDDEAMEHLAAKRYDASIRCFTDAIRLDYDNAEYHVGRALAYYGRGDFPVAVEDFTTAISIDSEYGAAYSGRGLAHAMLGDYEQATRDQDEAIRLDPLNMRAHLGRDFTNLLKAAHDGTTAGLLRVQPGRTAPPTEETD